MNITCPCCALKFPLIAGLNDSDARRVAAIMGELPPPLAPLLMEYLGLFKPPKSGLTWTRMHRLLSELATAMKSAEITRRGRCWAAPAAHWRVALQAVIDRRERLTLPMKNHGYLYDVLVSLAEKAEAGKERQREAQRRARPVLTQDNAQDAQRTAIRADLRHVNQLYDMAPTEALKTQIEQLKAKLDESKPV